MGANKAMMIEGMVNISLERNSMLGIWLKVWLMSGKEDTTVIPDITPIVAMRSSESWIFLFIVLDMRSFIVKLIVKCSIPTFQCCCIELIV